MTAVAVRKTEMLKGEICAPPSKAYTQRMTIAAALASGTSKISNPLFSDDTEATLRAVTSLGAKVNATKDCLTVKGVQTLKAAQTPIDCGESGATLRFMIPVAALASGPSTFLLGKSLEQRPMEPLLKSLKQLGVDVQFQRSAKKTSIFVKGGGIQGGQTTIRGDVSSQFISGLMFACPLATAETQIDVTPPLESKGYVKMTQTVLAEHGAEVSISENYDRLRIPPNQKYKPCNHRVPGDFSSCTRCSGLRVPPISGRMASSCPGRPRRPVPCPSKAVSRWRLHARSRGPKILMRGGPNLRHSLRPTSLLFRVRNPSRSMN